MCGLRGFFFLCLCFSLIPFFILPPFCRYSGDVTDIFIVYPTIPLKLMVGVLQPFVSSKLANIRYTPLSFSLSLFSLSLSLSPSFSLSILFYFLFLFIFCVGTLFSPFVPYPLFLSSFVDFAHVWAVFLVSLTFLF